MEMNFNTFKMKVVNFTNSTSFLIKDGGWHSQLNVPNDLLSHKENKKTIYLTQVWHTKNTDIRYSKTNIIYKAYN